MAEQYVITELSISDVRVSIGMPYPEQTPIGPFDSREAALEYAHQMQRRYGNGGGSVEVGTLVPPITRPDTQTGDGAMRWLAVQERARQMLSENPDWRHGQALFNALHEIDPVLANEIRGTEADPFHGNAMERIGEFGVAVMSHTPPATPSDGAES